ncbi:nitrogen fixation protein NifR [Staphylococcus aureus]|nr:nitrogen fixation protein NifR [Staphylococcus aureus]RZH80124.1 nitrogen fixation protein NifR [Staphylococcus aureus]
MTNSNRQCKLAGPQQREIGSPISTDNASWGGAQHRSWRKVSIQKCASWRGPNREK